MISAEGGLSQHNRTLGQWQRLRVLAPSTQVGRCPIQQPPGLIRCDRKPLGVLTHRQHLRQQPLTLAPSGGLPALVRERRPQHCDRAGGDLSFPVRVEAGPDHRLHQTVHPDLLRGQLDQRVAARHAQGVVVADRIRHDRPQRRARQRLTHHCRLSRQ